MVFMGTVKTLLTFEEFEQLPDQPGKQELVRGELIDMPPADYKHNDIADRIYGFLKAALDQAHARGEARVFHEMGYLLSGANWVQPDVSITHAGQSVEQYLIGVPAIAIEVVSPNNTAKRIDAKAELYFQFGAREVWRFLPKKKQVMIQVPGGAQVIGEDAVITTPLLPGLALTVKEIFGD